MGLRKQERLLQRLQNNGFGILVLGSLVLRIPVASAALIALSIGKVIVSS